MGKSQRIHSMRRVPHADKCQSGAAANLPGYSGGATVDDDFRVSTFLGASGAVTILHYGRTSYHPIAAGDSVQVFRKQGQKSLSFKFTHGRNGSEKERP